MSKIPLPSLSLARLLLVLITFWLLSLSAWSIQISLRLENSRMLIKGSVFALYALLLLIFTLRSRSRSQVILLAALLLGLLGGEGFTRLTNPSAEDPDYRQGSPYIMFAGRPNGLIEKNNIRLTPLGYRDEVLMPKPASEYRIIMLGGSTVFLGEPAIPAALESILAVIGHPNVQVYNWGVFSVVSGQELATILFRAVDFDPDMILVYNGVNDLTEPFFFDPRPNYPFDYMAAEGGRRIIEGDFSLYDLYAVLLRPSSLGYRLFQFEIEEQITRRDQLAEQIGAESQAWREALVTSYRSNLAKMCRLGEAFDFQLVAVLQPMIFFKPQLAGEEVNWLGTADYQQHTRAVYELARAAFLQLDGQFADNACVFWDGSRLLENETAELFVDPVHLNEVGNRIVAARLAEQVIPLIE